ncbi:tetratricopeptide repeat protein [Tropicimonas sp. IMCC6043]|uniref:tetratricopeptide repeat protein n=1 Tax=Tropicimonas sp. IMCC6043 TaxID=2510645 RepID=UPI00101D2372|nr:tetratricopeptide repeat protein [Tropicimonas sp. IMCC6043]RYH06445.1 tetratricopeptide repeat protein [Tropicimonas sp. IMCC6043]
MTKPGKIVSIGSFSFDLEAEALLSPDGTNVALRPQTARVLGILAAEPGELVTKDSVMSAVWAETHVTDDSLVQCISEIRKALGPQDAGLLVTVPKQGYRLDARAAALEQQDENLLAAPTGKPSLSLWRRFAPVGLGAVALLFVLSAGAIVFLYGNDNVPSGKITIAVLPFENVSGDAEQDYLSSGLAEDLLTDLSRIDSIAVLSRTATFGLRSAMGISSDMMEALGADYLVDGSVQRDGGQIRISAQLVQLSTGENIWAERYDRRLGDLFEVQDDVRNQIIDALSVTLAWRDMARLSSPGTADIEAYDLLLRGRFHEASLTRDGVIRAISFYRQAIDADPSYSQAYARLANMYDFSARFGWGESSEADRALALEMAEQSVRLGPDYPFAHWTLGRVLSRLGRDASSRGRAMEELERAIELDPNYADAHAFLSLIYIGAGETEEARKAIATAFDLNPAPPSWYFQNRGIVNYFQGLYELAAGDFRGAVEQNPTAAFSRTWLAAAYAMSGNVDDAQWEIEEAMALGEVRTVTEVLAANPIIQHPEFRDIYTSGLQTAGLPD